MLDKTQKNLSRTPEWTNWLSKCSMLAQVAQDVGSGLLYSPGREGPGLHCGWPHIVLIHYTKQSECRLTTSGAQPRVQQFDWSHKHEYTCQVSVQYVYQMLSLCNIIEYFKNRKQLGLQLELVQWPTTCSYGTGYTTLQLFVQLPIRMQRLHAFPQHRVKQRSHHT